MFSVTSRAKAELALVLAESPSAEGDPVMRLEEVDGEICLRADARRPEDVVFALEGPGLLCIAKRLVDELGDRKLELRESTDGAVFEVVD